MPTKERKGEIAYALWKYRLKKEGIRLDAMDREIGNIAAAVNIEPSELHDFAREVAIELVTEAFGTATE